jgi:hypothetical protein
MLVKVQSIGCNVFSVGSSIHCVAERQQEARSLSQLAGAFDAH